MVGGALWRVSLASVLGPLASIPGQLASIPGPRIQFVMACTWLLCRPIVCWGSGGTFRRIVQARSLDLKIKIREDGGMVGGTGMGMGMENGRF